MGAQLCEGDQMLGLICTSLLYASVLAIPPLDFHHSKPSHSRMRQLQACNKGSYHNLSALLLEVK